MVVVGFAIVIITSRHALLRRCASRSWLVFASKHRHGSSRIGRCVYRGGQSLRQSWGRYCASLVEWIICLTVQNCLGEACLDLHFVSPVPYAPCSMFDNVNFFRRSTCFLSVALSGARKKMLSFALRTHRVRTVRHSSAQKKCGYPKC
jgi:hypothetical protein